jgi:LysR family transcriptional regulator, carnitine catabolism transcriptional activator
MPLINVSPSDLEAFLAVAESGSFSRSATALGLSQPAVSARIKHLEAVLGVTLFHRTSRRVAISESGERLRIRLERTMGELRGLLKEFDAEASLRKGRIRIGASPSIASSFLPEAIARFNKRWPEIELSLQDDFYGRDLARLAKGDVDFAVIPFDQPTEQFRFERLLRDSFTPIVPKGHKLASKKRVTLADLAKEPLVTVPPESAAWATLKGAFGRAGLEFDPRFQTQSALSVVAMVRAGMGIGFLTRLGQAQIMTNDVTPLVLADFEIGRDVGIVTVQGRSLSHAAATFCKVLREVTRAYSTQPLGHKRTRT